jgi:hypothetical protein
VYEAHTGRLNGDILTREGNYREAFPEDITGAIRLNGNWSEDELEDWGTEAPMFLLDALQADLDAARHEMSARVTTKQDSTAPASSQQAAS